MAEARATRDVSVPWSVQLYAVAPLPPAVVGVLITVGVFSLYVLKDLFLSSVQELRTAPGGAPWLLVTPWMELLQAALIGYLPTASAYNLRAAAHDLRALRPALDITETEFAERLRSIASFKPGLLLVSGLIGACVGLSIPFMDGYWVHGRPPLGDPDLTWNILRNVLFAWLVARTMHIEIVTAGRFSTLGRSSAQVDLLDLAPLTPFARRGLRSVLVLMLFAALFSLLMLSPFILVVMPVTVVFIFSVAVAALLLPVVGVHQRIAEVKQAELARVRVAIRRESELRLGSEAPTGGSGAPLSDILAYEARIASVTTWPFDLNTLTRFGFYVMLGASSWLGSAFVERMLETALD